MLKCTHTRLFSIAALLVCCLQAGETWAQTCRALLVGINTYTPAAQTTSASGRTSYSNLSGCVNDVAALREVLIARFQFAPANVHVLLESEARRAEILSQIQQRLIDEAAPGDVCVFFYAGHGSQVRNLKSNKPSLMDSTIVPADSAAGAPDIRNKELARLFNRALDKGVKLTAVFDSCHSGTIARGLPAGLVGRDLPPDPQVISDPPDAGLPPEERGALIFSAAQDYQIASEWHDEHFTPHGAFTVALLKALSSTPAKAPAEQLFLTTQMLLQTEISGQIPVLAGITERRQKPLLGLGTSVAASGMVVAALASDFDTGLITLRGGQAIGLQLGCELRRLPRLGESTNQSPITIEVVTVDGFATATGKVTAGNFKAVQSGDLFEVTRWVYPAAASLRVWLPPCSLTAAALKKLAPELEVLRGSSQIQWVDDPAAMTPSNVLGWDATGWTLSGVGALGKQWRAQDVLKKLDTTGSGKPKLFVNLPAPVELSREMKLGKDALTNSVQAVASNIDANYWLAGHWNGTAIEYCWIRPNASEADTQLVSLPIRTDWIALDGGASASAQAARQLAEAAVHTGRLKAWLTLQAHGSSGYFPYHLMLRNPLTGQTKATGDRVSDGEAYGFELVADAGAELDRVQPQWIYVLASDSWGRTVLLYPTMAQGNVGNRLPYSPVDPHQTLAPREISLGNPNAPKLLTVQAPFGVDTYVLLTSTEPIPAPDQLNSDGVRTRGPGDNNPLQQLLQNIGSPNRDATTGVPTDWSIQRISIRSQPKAN